MNNNGLAAYRATQNQAQVEVANPYQLIQLLFKELMTTLSRVRGSIERQQYAEKGTLIGHSVEIIMALNESLDIKAGGDMAENLRSIYKYSIQKLLEAGPENSLEKIDEVTGLIKQIQEAWEEIGPQQASETGAPSETTGASGNA